MTKQPVIGIAANQRLTDMDSIPWSYTPSGFPNSIIQAGGLPLIIPINKPETAKTYIDIIDKLILTGGQNVSPHLYGEDKSPEAEDDYLEQRDAFEVALANEAIKQNKPIFAVCRGMQLMNVVLGGTLYQNIPNHWQRQASDTLTQTVDIAKESSLSAIYGNTSAVNSLHHQAIKDLAKPLRVVATNPQDHTIEAVESIDPNLSFMGVQWHPELLIHSDSDHSQKLFDFIVHSL